MASKNADVKKSSNKSILSQSNGTAEKTSPKSAALLKSPTSIKTSPKTTSVKNGTDSIKLNNCTGIKKMETGSPPKVARSPSAKSITPPNKATKNGVENCYKSNTLERQNSQGDCSNVQSVVKSDLIVDNGVVHSNGNCEAMLSMEYKLKENHFALESADNKEECTLKNGHADIASTEDNKGDCAEIATFTTEQDRASGDKACVKDKPEIKLTGTENGSLGLLDDKTEVYEDAKSDLNDSIFKNGEATTKDSPNSTTTDCTQCSAETAKLLPDEHESEPVGEPEVTKQSIRIKVWDHLDKNDLVVFPRPCQGRIPNFKGAPAAAEKLIALEVFRNSKTIKVNPDKPQEMVRFHTLEFGKRLLVPVPRLREGLFQAVVPPTEASKYQLQQASQRYGMKKWSRPISLDDKITIDLVVLGSVVVDKKGHRLGKGEGFADLEFAMLMKMKAIDEKTVIVTTVHDDQIYDELPEHLFREHDVPVDWIVTPTQVIEIKEKLPRPTKILWNILSNRRILEIPILQKLREEELGEGQDCTLKEVDSDVEEKAYVQRFTRRRRFNYSRSTGDPVRDNKMYAPAPPRQQYYYRVPRGRYMQHPPPSNRPNNYGPPPIMRNEPRHMQYYQESPYQSKQQMGPRPQQQRMREARPRSMSRGNRQMNRPQSMGRPQSQNRSRSMNRSISMNRPNGPNRMNPRQQNGHHIDHQSDPQYPMNSPHVTKSVEVQTINNKSRPNRTYVKRKRAPIEFSLRVKNIGMGVRVRDLKVALNERGIKPRDITWRGYKGFAFLHFVKQGGKENRCTNIEEVIKTLKDLPLPPKDKKSLVIEPLQNKKDEGDVGALPNAERDTVIKEVPPTEASLEKTITA